MMEKLRGVGAGGLRQFHNSGTREETSGGRPGGQTAETGGKRDTEPDCAEIVDTVSFLVHKGNGAYT
mgnify:CR=1 FL=1